MQKNNISWIFFGTGDDSVIVLDRMKELGFLPNVVVTGEDKPQGRNLEILPPPAKVWTEKNNIQSLQLKSLKNAEEEIKSKNADVFVVASYGKIIPDTLLNLPRYGILNIHPSLLPKLRGPSPIVSAILEEDETGVSIIKLGSKIDAGPIISQEKVKTFEWPPYEKDLAEVLWKTGADLLAQVFEKLSSGKISEMVQDENQVTWSKKIKKEDALLNLNDNPNLNLRKIRAFHNWPRAYFFEKGKRIVVKKARAENGELILERVVPEGKKEMDYTDFKRN